MYLRHPTFEGELRQRHDLWKGFLVQESEVKDHDQHHLAMKESHCQICQDSGGRQAASGKTYQQPGRLLGSTKQDDNDFPVDMFDSSHKPHANFSPEQDT